MWNLLLKHEKWPRDRNKSVDVANIGFDTSKLVLFLCPRDATRRKRGREGERERGGGTVVMR